MPLLTNYNPLASLFPLKNTPAVAAAPAGAPGEYNPLVKLFGPTSAPQGSLQELNWNQTQKIITCPTSLAAQPLSVTAQRVSSVYLFSPPQNTQFITLVSTTSQTGKSVDFGPGQGVRLWTDGPAEVFDLSQWSVVINTNVGQLAQQLAYLTVFARTQNLTDLVKPPGMVHIAIDGCSYLWPTGLVIPVQDAPIQSLGVQTMLTVNGVAVANPSALPSWPSQVRMQLLRNLSTAGQIIDINRGPVGAANYGGGYPLYPTETLWIPAVNNQTPPCFTASAAGGTLSVSPFYT